MSACICPPYHCIAINVKNGLFFTELKHFLGRRTCERKAPLIYACGISHRSNLGWVSRRLDAAFRGSDCASNALPPIPTSNAGKQQSRSMFARFPRCAKGWLVQLLPVLHRMPLPLPTPQYVALTCETGRHSFVIIETLECKFIHRTMKPSRCPVSQNPTFG